MSPKKRLEFGGLKPYPYVCEYEGPGFLLAPGDIDGEPIAPLMDEDLGRPEYFPTREAALKFVECGEQEQFVDRICQLWAHSASKSAAVLAAKLDKKYPAISVSHIGDIMRTAIVDVLLENLEFLEAHLKRTKPNLDHNEN